jgi:hypothetical protein
LGIGNKAVQISTSVRKAARFTSSRAFKSRNKPRRLGYSGFWGHGFWEQVKWFLGTGQIWRLIYSAGWFSTQEGLNS